MNDESIEELPVPRVELRRDNKPHTIAPWFWPVEDGNATKAANEALHRLHQVQPQSWEWAMNYEGWSIVRVNPNGTVTQLNLDGEFA